MTQQANNPDNDDKRAVDPDGPSINDYKKAELPRSTARRKFRQKVDTEFSYGEALCQLMRDHKWGEASDLLFSAIRDEERFDLQVTSVVNHRSRKTDGLPPLLLAARTGAPRPLITQLLDLGAKVNANAFYTEKKTDQHFDGITALHFAAKNKDVRFVEILLRAGADPSATTANGYTPLHFVFRQPHKPIKYKIASMLLDRGADINAASSDMGTCLWHCIALSGYMPESARKAYRNQNIAPDPTEVRKVYSTKEAVRFLVEHGAHLEEDQQDPPKLEGFENHPALESSEDLLLALEEHFSRIPVYNHSAEDVRYQALDIYRVTNKALPVWLFLQGLDDATETHKVPAVSHIEQRLAELQGEKVPERTELYVKDNVALTHMARHLLFDLPQSESALIAREIELKMDSNEDIWGWHPNEAELLLLMNHPQNKKLEKEDTNPLTAGYTSIFRFLENDVKVTRRTVENWGRIGTLGFSFQHWRYDAQPITSVDSKGDLELVRPSLLEQFHFERVPSRPTDYSVDLERGVFKQFGSGFVFRAKNLSEKMRAEQPQLKSLDDFFIEFRQAYILVSHPEHGSLLIRNSSPTFGRDSFDHPAYYSWRGVEANTADHNSRPRGYFRERDLLDLDHEFVASHFHQIGELEINKRRQELNVKTKKLLQAVDTLQDSFARWKFDTRIDSAWTDFAGDGKRYLVGGHRSPGFVHLVDYLAHRFNRIERTGTGEMPALAFANPKYPPWRHFSYQAETGDKQRRFHLNRERIDGLLTLAHSKLFSTHVEDVCRETGIGEFFSQAGLKHPGSHLLLVPSQES